MRVFILAGSAVLIACGSKSGDSSVAASGPDISKVEVTQATSGSAVDAKFTYSFTDAEAVTKAGLIPSLIVAGPGTIIPPRCTTDYKYKLGSEVTFSVEPLSTYAYRACLWNSTTKEFSAGTGGTFTTIEAKGSEVTRIDVNQYVASTLNIVQTFFTCPTTGSVTDDVVLVITEGGTPASECNANNVTTSGISLSADLKPGTTYSIRACVFNKTANKYSSGFTKTFTTNTAD